MRRQTRRQSSRRGYKDEHMHQLITGRDFYDAAFNADLGLPITVALGRDDTPAELTEACRKAWPALRQQALEWCAANRPCTRPLAWWLWGSPQPRDYSQSEFAQLDALGVLTADEIRAFVVEPEDDHEQNGHAADDWLTANP
jgi:hypothetical protein